VLGEVSLLSKSKFRFQLKLLVIADWAARRLIVGSDGVACKRPMCWVYDMCVRAAWGGLAFFFAW